MAEAARMENLLVPVEKGSLAELHVSNAIQLQTNGRLRCARPQPDDHGQDYSVYQPHSPLRLALQIKSAWSPDRFGAYQFLLDLEDIPKDARHFFVACVFGTPELPGLRDVAFLINGARFLEQHRRSRQASFKLYPRRGRGSKYDTWRMPFARLGPRLVALLEEQGNRLGVPLETPEKLGLSRIFKGRLGEDCVAHLLMAGSEGRLGVFRPIADSIGLDLSVVSREPGVRTAVQVKTDFVKSQGASLAVQVPENTFRASPDRLMLFAAFVPSLATLAPTLWGVPTQDFDRLAPRKRGHLVFHASPRSNADDVWTGYRIGHGDLAMLLERRLARASRAGADAAKRRSLTRS